MKSWQ